MQQIAVSAAMSILRRLTAGVFSLCPIKIRPCRRRCTEQGYRFLGDPLPWYPAMLDGQIYNLSCGCAGECGCGPLCEIILDPPAHSIIEIKINGLVLPPSAYRVDDYRRLLRVDGGCWPDCQELDRPDIAPGTWSVSYWSGSCPDAGASLALTDLAVNLWRACTGDKGCALGDNVKQVTREGVTIDFDQTLEAIRSGGTGLKRVDLWIYSVNPHGLRRRMRVYSPDVPTHRRTTYSGQTGLDALSTRMALDVQWQTSWREDGWNTEVFVSAPTGITHIRRGWSDIGVHTMPLRFHRNWLTGDPSELTLTLEEPYYGLTTSCKVVTNQQTSGSCSSEVPAIAQGGGAG